MDLRRLLPGQSGRFEFDVYWNDYSYLVTTAHGNK
jgi:hypothetical protein